MIKPSWFSETMGSFCLILAQPPIWRGRLAADYWQQLGQRIRQQGGRLLGIWGEHQDTAGANIHAFFLTESGYLWCTLPLPANLREFPSLSSVFPTACRQERAIRDLLGLEPLGNPDMRPWLRHAAWPANIHPLAMSDIPEDILSCAGEIDYSYRAPAGQDLHEIPVGPVHAGTIEPGHFRFTCLGEQIVQLEERLGYCHKGIERLFVGQPPDAALRLAGRVSGDSSVAYAWSYAMAVESVAEIELSQRALALRGLCLERERLANHLGDLGALGNDAGLAFALTQLLAIKEELLRENAEIFGHRYLMEVVQLGGVAVDLDGRALQHIEQSSKAWRRRLETLDLLLQEHAGLRDRLVATGPITAERAAYWGMAGLSGRASGQAWDLRTHFAPPPYDRYPMEISLARRGDVAARWAVRFAEVFRCLRWQENVVANLPGGSPRVALKAFPKDGEGLGICEGWRGEVFVALRLEDRHIARCHPHDPSWSLWPVLEEAVCQDIVADFPLINKSFNLSYSGQDL